MLRYVYCFLLFFSFRVVRIRRRRKVHVRYLIRDEFLVDSSNACLLVGMQLNTVVLFFYRLH